MIHIRHCYYCGKLLSRRKATKDHVIPRSKGGSDSTQNIVDACRDCNKEKGCLTIEEFRVVMAFRQGALKPPKAFRFPGEFEF
jgi:5-methylcytosine-specific restriction endonuclease McrA